jgi:hypothetical protein
LIPNHQRLEQKTMAHDALRKAAVPSISDTADAAQT